MITQIFILGSSSAYGVGSASAGWGDLIKQYLHSNMYGAAGVGEKYEVYNFAKSGATVDFVKETFPQQLAKYSRGYKSIVLVSVGGNNAKAEDEPENFVSTPEEYKKEMGSLFTMLKQHTGAVVFVGGGYVDEKKTNPKPNPLTGGRSYFSNERRSQFAEITKQLCREHDIMFAGVSISEEEWFKEYIYKDGLHPNDKGHRLIFETVRTELEKML